MNNGVRLGLIGAGRWGRNYIKTIRNLEGIGLTYLASRNPKARQWVDEDCKITKKWKEVADVDNIDGVIIVTPPRLHAEMTRFFLDVGLPVLVEKPLTMNLGEAETLLEFAENKGSIVLVDHTQLFNPAWKSFKDYASGMGKVLKIESIAGNWGPFRRETPVLWDWGPHDLALCLDIFKKVPETLDVKWVDRRNIGRDKGEIIKLSLGFGDNTQVQITIGNILPEKKRTFTVTFEKGILVFNDLVPEKLKRFLNNQQYEEGRGEVLPFSSESPLSCVIRTFSNRLKKHKSHLSDLRLAVQITSILNEAQNMLRLEKP